MTNPILDVYRIPDRWLRAYAWIAAVLFAAAVLTHVATYGPADMADTVQAVTFALFPTIFPVFGAAVVVAAFGRLDMGRLMGATSMVVKVAGGLLAAYVFVDFFRMVALLPGQPVEQGGSFFYGEHSRTIPITFETYRQGLMYQARLFSGHELLFLGVAALLGRQVHRLRRGELAPGRPAAAGRSLALPPPLTSRVTFSVPLTADEVESRLAAQALQGPAGWFGETTPLSGWVSDSRFSLELGGASNRQLVFASGVLLAGPATTIELTATFKLWSVVTLLVSAVSLPVVGAVMVATLHTDFPLIMLSAMAAFGVVANVGYGLWQRRRLVAQIRRTLET